MLTSFYPFDVKLLYKLWIKYLSIRRLTKILLETNSVYFLVWFLLELSRFHVSLNYNRQTLSLSKDCQWEVHLQFCIIISFQRLLFDIGRNICLQWKRYEVKWHVGNFSCFVLFVWWNVIKQNNCKLYGWFWSTLLICILIHITWRKNTSWCVCQAYLIGDIHRTWEYRCNN